jgi:FkbM family methyltransferase
LGRVLRFPLDFIPKETQVPILQGKLRGKKWIVGSSNHGCWLGSYEYKKQIIFEKTIIRESVVFDLGANVGFYTLLASVLVGPSGKVFAFEPLPRNLFLLREHLRINRITNVSIIEGAVSDRSGSTTFEEGQSSATGHLSRDGKVRVATTTLDELWFKGAITTPDFIKIDIEGAEMKALVGARAMLESAKATIFLATHGSPIHQECCHFLSGIGYKLTPIDGRELEKSSEVLAVCE